MFIRGIKNAMDCGERSKCLVCEAHKQQTDSGSKDYRNDGAGFKILTVNEVNKNKPNEYFVYAEHALSRSDKQLT